MASPTRSTPRQDRGGRSTAYASRPSLAPGRDSGPDPGRGSVWPTIRCSRDPTVTILQRIAVIGAGAWGAALANVAARAGRDVVLVARDADAADAVRRAGASPHLPDVALDGAIAVAGGIDAVAGADAVLLVVPAQAHGAVAATLAPVLAPGTPVVACA
ncbi:hypothetical protein CCR97_28900, partial [Rhodoplanes elegans]|nr:hypothetical protein [Rhodoplanes elegans]